MWTHWAYSVLDFYSLNHQLIVAILIVCLQYLSSFCGLGAVLSFPFNSLHGLLLYYALCLVMNEFVSIETITWAITAECQLSLEL